MALTKIRAEHLDGTVEETTTRTHMCAADQVGFERRFGVSAGVMNKMAGLFDPDTGAPLPGADLGEMKIEWVHFFAYQPLVREAGVTASFDEWQETLLELQTIDVEGAETPDPLAPTASSPS
jgi:hypothetical protein